MPRLGMGMPVTASGQRAAALVVDDNFWLNDVSNHITPDFTGTRKNLLLQSQTLKTTWTTNNAAIPNDLFEAPDNSLTAQAITASSAGASDVYVKQASITIVAGETYTYSVHVKAGANGFVRLVHSDNVAVVASAYFNISTGAASNTSNILTSSFDKMDDSWIRVSITFQTVNANSNSHVRIESAAAAGSTGTGAAFQAGTELIYVWGAQLEEDSRNSEYLVTTNTAVTKTVPLVDFHDSWDHDVDGDGVKTNDITIEADPDGEGVWDVDANGDLIPLDV